LSCMIQRGAPKSSESNTQNPASDTESYHMYECVYHKCSGTSELTSIIIVSHSRAREADLLKDELVKARVAEKNAKEKLMELARSNITSTPAYTVSHTTGLCGPTLPRLIQ
jgi:hypothetical protein